MSGFIHAGGDITADTLAALAEYEDEYTIPLFEQGDAMGYDCLTIGAGDNVQGESALGLPPHRKELWAAVEGRRQRSRPGRPPGSAQCHTERCRWTRTGPRPR
jgi:hypothetical protein